MKNTIIIPADVPKNMQSEFIKNYEAITQQTGRVMLFAGDQKMEHLNRDFYGENIHPDAQRPEHIFEIASKSTIGVFASQFGLITRYGAQFPNINYLVKLNSKTNLVTTKQRDPISSQLWCVDDVVQLKQNSGLLIRGIGCTIYLGSEFESHMLTQAAQAVHQAHQHGLVAILWMYPRGASVPEEKDANLIAGAAGVAACLGADFAKVNPPKAQNGKTSAQLLKQAVAAAGNTKLICAGGAEENQKQFLQTLHDQIHIGGVHGNATGRNIYQQSQQQAIAMANAISAIVFDQKSVQEACAIASK